MLRTESSAAAHDLVLDRKLDEARDKILHNNSLQERKYQMIANHLVRVSKSLETEQQALEAQQETRSVAMRALECSCEIELAVATQACIDFESRCKSEIDEKIASHVVSVARVGEMRGEMLKKCVSQAADDLQAFAEAVSTEAKLRDDEFRDLKTKMHRRLDHMHSLLAVQQKVREESHRSTLQTLQDISDNLLRDIHMEKQTREEGERAFLRVMEAMLARWSINKPMRVGSSSSSNNST